MKLNSQVIVTQSFHTLFILHGPIPVQCRYVGSVKSSEYLTHFYVSKSFSTSHSLYGATKQNTIMWMKLQELPVNPLSFIVRFDIDIHISFPI